MVDQIRPGAWVADRVAPPDTFDREHRQTHIQRKGLEVGRQLATSEECEGARAGRHGPVREHRGLKPEPGEESPAGAARLLE